MKLTKFSELNKSQKDLVTKAESVMKNAYNPLSHFYVGAALLTKKGNIYLGTFAENSSLGLTICAEPAAILAANTAGERNYKAMAVIGGGEKFDCNEPITPCGRCRQIISDFAQVSDYDIKIICCNTKKDKIILTKISELLPLAFGPKDVKTDVKKFNR